MKELRDKIINKIFENYIDDSSVLTDQEKGINYGLNLAVGVIIKNFPITNEELSNDSAKLLELTSVQPRKGEWIDHESKQETKQQAIKASDSINREDAITKVALEIWHYPNELYTSLNCFENCQELAEQALNCLPSAESVKAYTKADYIMALHKEYGCTLTMAEEAHNKALEHLRSKARMKG